MLASWLLAVAAAIEAAIGLALIVSPQAVSRLLLGAHLAGAGIAVGRVAGIALLCFGMVCWMSRHVPNKTPALSAMLAYNLLVATYLMYLGLDGELVGILLWPVIALHAVLSVLFAYVSFNDRLPATR
jgi:hypothetical protein